MGSSRRIDSPARAGTDFHLDLLDAAVIRARTHADATIALSLPGALAALAADEIATFPALRPHQRHAWHAFLCQVGALALVAAGHDAPWTEPAPWRAALAALTPENDDTTWSLVARPDRPALLQPPVPDGLAALKNRVPTPDALDMLVTSRNHDLKAAVMRDAAPEDWLFALVTLQTMEGYFGATKYGISRMNGGLASRPALGIAPGDSAGHHFARDIGRLLALRGKHRSSGAYKASGGLALLWLEPWDGNTSLPPHELDELYVEVCRRVRLVVTASGRLAACAGGSKAPRVAATAGGLTGDPWAPLVPDGRGLKVFTVTGSGFDYRQMVRLLWPKGGIEAPLQPTADTDAPQGLTLVARALARGKGKTEGYHERRVPISRKLTRRTVEWTDRAARVAQERVDLAGEAGRVLRAALMALFQGGPDEIDFRDKDSGRKAKSFADRLDVAVDRVFFEDLWREIEADDDQAERRVWVRGLMTRAEMILADAEIGAPKTTRRRLRAAVNARATLHGIARSSKSKLAPYL